MSHEVLFLGHWNMAGSGCPAGGKMLRNSQHSWPTSVAMIVIGTNHESHATCLFNSKTTTNVPVLFCNMFLTRFGPDVRYIMICHSQSTCFLFWLCRIVLKHLCLADWTCSTWWKTVGGCLSCRQRRAYSDKMGVGEHQLLGLQGQSGTNSLWANWSLISNVCQSDSNYMTPWCFHERR